jgi:O-antigen/teichoic acid export membrane protein
LSPPNAVSVSEAPAAQRRASFARQGALTVVFSGLTLATNLVTGVLVARALGASGRGQLTAVLTATQMVGWTFAFGCSEATAYREARHGRDDGVVSAWLVLSVPAGLLAVLVGEALLPVLLHAQTSETLHLAQLFMLSAFFVPLGLLSVGLLLGARRFLLYNLFGLFQPAAVAFAYVVLWRLDLLTAAVALVANVVVSLTVGAPLAVVTLRGRITRPAWTRAWPNIWYGARVHGTNLGGMMNARLDLLIIPAFLTASSVGLYSVATNVSWVVVTIATAIATIVLPEAARDPQRGVTTVVRSLQATLGVALALAVGIAAVADVALRVLYGASFAAAHEALLLLLPGSVFYACAGVLWSGLYALNRPLTAAATQAFGALITVVGLVLFLERGGITAAALVSTASYAGVFLAGLALYRRAAGLAWRDFVVLETLSRNQPFAGPSRP